ncbi:MAG: PHP domain-containing protein, partial [Thermoanaerobaculia bacterium]
MHVRLTGRGAALRAGALGAAALLLGGCFLLPLGGKPNAAPGGGPSPLGGGLRDFRVAFHCHSHLSHDSEVGFDEIARTARRLGFNAVFLNDHYQPGNIARAPHGLWDGVLMVPGVEIRPGAAPPEAGTSRRGSLLIIGVERDFDGGAERVSLARELAAQGAVVAAGHCEEFDAWEPYPLHA